MRKSKACFMIALTLMFFVTLNSIFAVKIFDDTQTNGIYKSSEDNSDFKLPFFRASSDRMDIDSPLSQFGILCTASSIDINAPLEGLQVFVSDDTVRVNKDIRNAIILNNGNVIIDANVENTLFAYSAGTITISENANIKGNIICFAPNVELKGNIDGNILGYAENLALNGTVAGTVRVTATNVTTGENAKVEQGIFLNTENKDLKIDENVGEATIDITEVQKETFKTYAYRIITAASSNFFIFLIILIFVKKEKLSAIVNKMESKEILKKGFSYFFALLITTSIGIVLLMLLTRLGCAALIFAICNFVLFGILKNAIVGTFMVKLVEKIYSERNVKVPGVLAAIPTFLLLEILCNIPIVGIIISLMIYIIAMGIVLSIFKKEDNLEVTEVVNVE